MSNKQKVLTKTNVTTFSIESQKIHIIDGALNLDLVNQFFDYVSKLSFKKNERDDYDDRYPIFSTDFKTDLFEKETEIGKTARGFVTKFYNEKVYNLNRSYINMSFYGDMEFPHRDCQINEDDITVLYYVNNVWDYRWGGETLFYSGRDTVRAILPTPGRFLIFPGNIEHTGSVPTRICNVPRFSLAMKYVSANHQN
ncbi:2OG-Fe(II) oxygenase [Flagellimonas meridianipacifica]|uniref:2-oxoglutarate-Fe(II)-dependent oxygenase superfamily protein n=1 Tax=Flagellimonas meridianipacifica TaxID=1080225 RepID=A0A2T0MFM6_9FLAO|nr:2OG-Fe(II) oxygenase [Allomuricauda pacifica]PRX56380.1 2-oxoglutarate-Fe(II)-dependent oxygenase superfamily protein [Allomuricauda pacifica]